MAIMVFAVLFNCVLDAIFIFWFKWGIAGAAWATVLAQFIAMVLELWYSSGKRVEVSFSKEIFKLKKRIVGGILSIGMAPFLMNVTASVVVIFINNALQNNGGDMYIGAYGIANRVSFIFIMMVFGLNQGMQPIVGYNYGAKKYDRVHKALMMVIIAATCITTVGSLLCMIFPHAVAGIFTNDPTLLAIAEKALRITLLAFPIVGFQVVGSNFFQSIGMAPKAIFLSLTRQLIFLLPCLIILPPIFGANGVWMSLPIADTIASILTAILLVHQIRVFRRHNAQNNLNAM
jgi:putative MATE family efflux protein